MNITETFKGDDAQDEAIKRLATLMGTTEPIKKVDMRSYRGGVKLIFRTQETKNVQSKE